MLIMTSSHEVRQPYHINIVVTALIAIYFAQATTETSLGINNYNMWLSWTTATWELLGPVLPI